MVNTKLPTSNPLVFLNKNIRVDTGCVNFTSCFIEGEKSTYEII